MLALALILAGAAAISLLLGRYPIDPAQAVAMLVSKIVPVDPIWTEQQATLFFNVRLPRILLALMVGCCLACAGAAYQGIFQNPLVSPDILGASQGAAFYRICPLPSTINFMEVSSFKPIGPLAWSF